MLAKVAYEEEFKFAPGQTHLQQSQVVHHDMFKASYEKFAELLDTTRCQISARKESSHRPLAMDCADDSMEAKMMQVGVLQFCRPRSHDNEFLSSFEKRVDVCKTQGHQLGILPSKPLPREDAFCRCRAVMYDWLQTMSRWSLLIWFGELFGVCAVLYFGVESNLARMDSKSRRETLCFAAVGIAILAGRVTLFDGTLVSLQNEVEGEMGS